MDKKVVKPKIKPTSFRISNETKVLLKEIAEKEKRSEGKTIEVLVAEKAAAMGITAPKS